jgi:hypothetical protein
MSETGRLADRNCTHLGDGGMCVEGDDVIGIRSNLCGAPGEHNEKGNEEVHGGQIIVGNRLEELCDIG